MEWAKGEPEVYVVMSLRCIPMLGAVPRHATGNVWIAHVGNQRETETGICGVSKPEPVHERGCVRPRVAGQ